MAKPDKSRYVWLYLPSKADKDRWQALADKADATLSKFCISIVEEEFKLPRKMAKESENLRKNVKDLHENLRQKEIVLERYEAELKRYRSRHSMRTLSKACAHSKKLIEILKK